MNRAGHAGGIPRPPEPASASAPARDARETELRDADARYRTIFEMASDAMFVHDAETGAIVDANRQACQIVGCSREELSASGLLRISGGGQYDEEQALALIRRAAEGEPQRFEWPIRSPSGDSRWVEVKLQAIALQGRPHVLATVRDIHERKAAEEALISAREELEGRVAERTSALAAEIAERKLAQAELQRREEHFRLLIENSSDVASILDPQGVNIYQSPSGERVLGYKPEEMVGTSTFERIHPDDRALAREALGRVAANPGRTETVELRYRHRNGGWRILEASGRTLLPDSPRAGIVINSRDVTERRKAEEALRWSEQRFRSVVENASDLVTLLDPEGIILYQSPAIERTYGYRQDELVGRSAFELVHPDDVAPVLSRLADVVAHPGETRSAEFRFLHKEGHWVHVEAAGTTLSPMSAAEGVVVNSRDITDRKQTELRLRETTRFLENLIASSPGVIFRGAGESFRTMYISANAEAVLGYSAEEFLADPQLWFERTHPDDRESVAAKLQAAMEGGEVQLTYEYRFRNRRGVYRNLLASVRFERDEAAGSVEVLGYTFDVTPLKEAEAALRVAKDEAEAAREVAEQANRAKSEFLSRMSHELRTPMNSILGFAQLLARRDLAPDQARSVDHIIRGGRHLLNLINEVLDLARIEANRHTLSLEPVHAATLLSEVMSMMRPTAAQHACGLDETIPAAADRYVRADRQRLTQVILNLLSNAIKFNRPGGRVWVECEERAGEGLLSIGVRDSGMGIPKERMDELFLPFSRLEADEAGIEGTGLGLTLSRRLVEAMEGAMRVESEEGRGSTFWIDLPLSASPLEEYPRNEAPAEPTPVRQGGGRAATILYIEDNLANLSLIETIFDDRPEIQLIPALQGRLGLELARQHAPDLVLLDLHLPDLTGEEVLRQLRSDPATSATPVVVVSADATPRQIANLRESGAAEYLTKPLDIDRFRDVVDGLLAERYERMNREGR